MEYTKDIILDIGYKKGIAKTKLNNWTSRLKKGMESNKIVMSVLVLLTTLMIIDMILINFFLQLFSKVY